MSRSEAGTGDSKIDNAQLVMMTSQLVSAYVANNPVSVTDVIQMIGEVHASLKTVSGAPEPKARATEKPKPAVPVRKSVTDDFIICLEDGKQFKSLKRHLASNYNMTPDDYRQKWGLPEDYPMVAPSYAKQRSQLAKKIGLGRRHRGTR